MLISNIFATEASEARTAPSQYDGRTAIKPGEPVALEKYEWDCGEKTFVFSNKRGCSGRNVTPEQASDLLVALLER